MKTKIIEILNQKATLPVVAGVAGVAVGFFAGRYYQKRKTPMVVLSELDTVEQLQLDFEEVVVRPTHVDNHPSVPREEKLPRLHAVPDETGPEDVVVPRSVNIFITRGDPGDGWDWSSELEQRRPDKPYIIHIEEFVGQESGFNQDTVTYYAADDVIVDEQEQVISHYRELMGELLFGHGSQDANIVYVRNDKMGVEWEVLYDASSYLQSVISEHAMEEIIKHHRVPKFRKEE
jgi:hypothetical protein